MYNQLQWEYKKSKGLKLAQILSHLRRPGRQINDYALACAEELGLAVQAAEMQQLEKVAHRC